MKHNKYWSLVKPNQIERLYCAITNGYPARTASCSLCIAIITAFYLMYIGSFFEPDIYRFHQRLTYHELFEGKYLINELVDSIIISLSILFWSIISFRNKIVRVCIFATLASVLILGIIELYGLLDILSLISLPFVMTTYITAHHYKPDLIFPLSFRLTLNYLLVAAIILSMVSVFISVTSAKLNDPFVDIISLLSRFSPAILFWIIFSIPFKIILDYCIEKVPRVTNQVRYISESFQAFYSTTYEFRNPHTTVFVLGFLLFFSVAIILIPNLDRVEGPIGEDTMIYVDWIRELEGTSLNEIIHKSFVEIQNGDRPLSLLLISLIAATFPNNPVTVIDLVLPLFLSPLLVLTFYFLTKELTKNKLIVFFTCFVTCISFQVIAGIYAGLYANWFALIPAYVSLVFLLRFLKTSRKPNLFLFSVSIIVLLFMHTYTWTIIILFVFLFTSIVWFQKIYPRSLVKFVFVVIFITVCIDVTKSGITGSTLGFTQDLLLAEETSFGMSNLEMKWNNIVHVSQVYLGGIFGNIILLALAIYGIVLIRFRNVLAVFVLVFISVSIIPAFFGGKIILSRVLYDIPLQLPIGLTLAYIFVSQDGRFRAFAILLSLLAVALYTLFNIASIHQNI